MAQTLENWNEGKGGEWPGFLGEFHSASDRVAAILGGAFLDEHLRVLLKQWAGDNPAELGSLLQMRS